MTARFLIMGEQENIPVKLARLLEKFRAIRDPADRIMTLIEFASQYLEPPASVARRPFPAAHRLTDAKDNIYLWTQVQPDRTMRFHFCIEHADGISTRALAVILQETLSGLPAHQIAAISPAIVDTIFGKDLSEKRRHTLRAMVEAVRHAAHQLCPQHDPYLN